MFSEIGSVTMTNSTLVMNINSSSGTTQDLHKFLKIVNWFTSINFRTIHENTFSEHTPGTGIWFLESPVYKLWLLMDKGLLWVKGLRKYRFYSLISNTSRYNLIAGAGKTVLS
jgi:hypothetical protein